MFRLSLCYASSQTYTFKMPKLTLLELPDLCLILILSRLQLNALLLISSVCAQLNQLKVHVCKRKTRLYLCPGRELLTSGGQFYDLINFFNLHQQVIRTQRHTLYTPHRKGYTRVVYYRNLPNLGQIFPNITHFGIFRIEQTSTDNHYIETFVEQLAKLLKYWKLNLTNLTVIINEPFINSVLYETMEKYLLNLKSMNIFLGGKNRQNLKKFFHLLSSRVRVRQLNLGPMHDLRKFYSKFPSTNTQLQSLGIIYPNISRLVLDLIEEKPNFDHTVTKFAFTLTLKHLSNLRNLSGICLRFPNLTHLEVSIQIVQIDQNYYIDFIELVRSISSLSKLKTLVIFIPKYPFKIQRFNVLQFPFWFRSNYDDTIEPLESVESVYLYLGDDRQTLTRITHPRTCTCSSLYRLVNGSKFCSLSHAFPNANLICNSMTLWMLDFNSFFIVLVSAHPLLFFLTGFPDISAFFKVLCVVIEIILLGKIVTKLYNV